MLQVELICSDPRCDAEMTLWVEDIGEVEPVACECGYGLVTMRVEGVEPVFAGV